MGYLSFDSKITKPRCLWKKTNTPHLIIITLVVFNISFAQSGPSQVMDSTVVNKEIFYSMHMYDSQTGEGIDGGAEFSAKYSDEDNYNSFTALDLYMLNGLTCPH